MEHRTNNPHGRPKGKPNKVTADLRQRIKIFLEGNFATIEKDFSELEPDRRIILFERYLKFVLPALQASSMDVNLSKMSDTDLDTILNQIIIRNNDKKTSSAELGGKD